MGVIGEGQIDFSSSVENEWLCSKLLMAYGLSVASTEMARFNGERCLIVQRFDRRLHQGLLEVYPSSPGVRRSAPV